MVIQMAVFHLYVVTNFLLKDHKLCPFVRFVFVVSVARKLRLLRVLVSTKGNGNLEKCVLPQLAQ
jgi:hypothetical protein